MKMPESMRGRWSETANSRALRSLARFMERHAECDQHSTGIGQSVQGGLVCYGHTGILPIWRLPKAYRRKERG